MNRLLPNCIVAIGLVWGGCGRQQQGQATSPVSAVTDNGGKVAVNPTSKDNSGHSSPSSKKISDSTTDLKVAYYRENFDSMVASGSLYHLELTPGALADPEIGRRLLEKFEAERREGRFWATGASLLGGTGNRSFAPLLWERWYDFPAYEPPDTVGWSTIQLELSNPKSVLVRAVFRIGDVETIKMVWQAFPTVAEGDQLLIAKASSDILDPLSAAEIVRILDAARSERVRVELVNAANGILYHLFTGGSETDRRWARETAIPLLSEMKKRGLVRDFLEKILPP